MLKFPDGAHRPDAEAAGEAQEVARQAGGQARRGECPQPPRPCRGAAPVMPEGPAPAMPGLPKEDKRWRKQKEDPAAPRSGHRRRQSGCQPEEAVFPAQEGMPLLRGKDRRHQLQGREAAARVRGGAGKIVPPPPSGVCAPHQRRSATPSRRHATSRCCVSRRRWRQEETVMEVILKKTSKSWTTASKW